jgi:hypothetical protein
MRRLSPSGLSWLSALAPAALLVLLGAAPVSAGVEVIDFEDMNPGNGGTSPLTEEYAELGVHFYSLDDASVWSGLSEGDPGGWQVEGTNGTRFLGFDGSSYSVVLTFDAPVQDFQFDLTRAAPHPFMAHQVVVAGLLGGEVVDEQIVYLGAVDAWMTLTVAGGVDQVVIEGPGQPGTRFAVDNVQWLGPDREVPDEPADDPDLEELPGGEGPAEMNVRVDVRSGKWLRLWTRGRRAIVPVVVFGDEDFDVSEVAVDTVSLDPDEGQVKHRSCPHFLDFDRDGRLDMMLHFRLTNPSFPPAEGEECVTGETTSGDAFSGCDDLLWNHPRRWWQVPSHGQNDRGVRGRRSR